MHGRGEVDRDPRRVDAQLSATSCAVTVSCELPQNGANIVAVTPPVGPIRIRTLSAVVVNAAAAPMLWNQNSLACR